MKHERYLVVWTFKFPDAIVEDGWEAHESLEDAQEAYSKLIGKGEVYTASLTKVLESTDY
jgi:hypothetical protein|tara:strand:- start:92 stop:271 length:180 start_codon:yes stop_codon:yes gene_type:complete